MGIAITVILTFLGIAAIFVIAYLYGRRRIKGVSRIPEKAEASLPSILEPGVDSESDDTQQEGAAAVIEEPELPNTMDDAIESEPVTQTPAINQNHEINGGVLKPETTDEEKEDKHRRIDPLDRGGRLKGAEDASQSKRERKPRQAKPEIVCWEKGRQWILGVEIPQEIYDNGNVEVSQNDSPLEEDSREYCWRLPQGFGEILVHSGSDLFKIDLGREGENYLLFKIIRRNWKEGRRVKSPSSGAYLIVVPDEWKAIDDNADHVQVDAAGYKAYWQVFEEADKTKVAFDKETIQSKSSKFRLVGKSVPDATEDAGLLFVENPPQIESHDIDRNDVSVIIGEIGESKWRKEILLENETENLPAEVMKRQSGRYFLRFYDKNNELMESQFFRFVRGLKSVNTPHVQPFPDIDARHNDEQIEIIHEAYCMIEPANDSAKDVSIKSMESKTILFIPPNPDYDRTIWRIGHKSGAKVELTILLERIWWGIEVENKEPSAWESQPEMLSKDKFLATSNLALWIRFPAPRWVDRVSIGFQQENKRSYPISVSEQTICVPLREFEITNPYSKNILEVWLEHNGKQCDGKVVVVSNFRPDWVGHGRKQTANAMAMMRKGTGSMEVNGLPFTEYFQKSPADANHYWQKLSEHEQIHDILLQADISFRVWGSNPHTKRLLKAVTHALAHALMQYKPELAPMLKRFRGVKVPRNAYNEEGIRNESD